MARTKQTARKNTGGKPLAMGRGKKDPKKNPTPGRSADRKVVLEYSSDEDLQPAEGAGAPKRVKKQIHLTLPTSPAHVTTTESFTAFFINHLNAESQREVSPDERIRFLAQNLWGRRTRSGLGKEDHWRRGWLRRRQTTQEACSGGRSSGAESFCKERLEYKRRTRG